MTSELYYLAYTALLTAALWVVYIASQVMANGFLTPQNYDDPTPRPVPNWGKRANRAHLNAVESFAPFAGSKRSTAFIRPMLPSWIRSSSGRP